MAMGDSAFCMTRSRARRACTRTSAPPRDQDAKLATLVEQRLKALSLVGQQAFGDKPPPQLTHSNRTRCVAARLPEEHKPGIQNPPRTLGQLAAACRLHEGPDGPEQAVDSAPPSHCQHLAEMVRSSSAWTGRRHRSEPHTLQNRDHARGALGTLSLLRLLGRGGAHRMRVIASRPGKELTCPTALLVHAQLGCW